MAGINLNSTSLETSMFTDFQRSVIAAAENKWDNIYDLCKPPTVCFMKHIAEWVSSGGNDTDLVDILNDNDSLFSEVDKEYKPLFLMCVNMAMMMPDEMGKTFLEIIVFRYCRPDTIGKGRRFNHMNNFSLLLHCFGPSLIMLVYEKLVHETTDSPQKVESYLTHEYHGDITQVCHRGKTFERSKVSYELFRSAVRMMEVGATSESSSLRIASAMLTRMLRVDNSLMNSCFLAATSNSNFNEIHTAVMSGKININSCSSYLDSVDRPFLAYLGHLEEKNFMKVITSWLPIIDYDIIGGTVNALLKNMKYEGSLDLQYTIRNLWRKVNSRWSDQKWSILMKRVDRTVLSNIDVVLATIYICESSCHTLDYILERVQFSPVELKIIATYAADNPCVISTLTRRYNWLAKVPITPCGSPILHYAIVEELPNFAGLLQVQAIRSNLNVINWLGITPLMTCCQYGSRYQYFRSLLEAGGELNFMTSWRETIFHFMATNIRSGDLLLKILDEWKGVTIPDVEVRREQDNMTALQLALKTCNFEMAKNLMERFGASASSLYALHSGINTADMMLLRLNTDALTLIKKYTATIPSFIRILFEYYEGKLDDEVTCDMCELPDKVWPAFREPRKLLNRLYHFPIDCPLNMDLIETYMKQFGSFGYTTNSTRAEAISSGVDADELQCAICLEKMDDHYYTLCSHRFHSRCLRTWLVEKSTCPMCRSEDIGTPPSIKVNHRPEKPLLNERCVVHPVSLPPPYKYIKTCTNNHICRYKLHGSSFVPMEYEVGGKWIEESMM